MINKISIILKEEYTMIEQYMALALQPSMKWAYSMEDIKENINHIDELIKAATYLAEIEMPVKLITIPEGALQGFTDEGMDWDHSYSAANFAIDVPGPETEMLSKIAQEQKVYLIFQARVRHPKFPGKYFNSAVLLNPSGDVILQSYKLQVFAREHTCVPHDIWDEWTNLYGTGLDAFYPVADTEIGRIGMMVCQEGDYPEPARGYAMNGAEVLYRASGPEPAISSGWWEVQNRARALDNTCYVVAPNVANCYPTPQSTRPIDNFGGNSMVVDYHGQVLNNHVSGGVSAYAGAIIDIEALRQYRQRSVFGNWMKDLRTEQYRIIYDEPLFEMNRCLGDKTPMKHAPTDTLYKEHIKKLTDKGIWVLPSYMKNAKK